MTQGTDEKSIRNFRGEGTIWSIWKDTIKIDLKETVWPCCSWRGLAMSWWNISQHCELHPSAASTEASYTFSAAIHKHCTIEELIERKSSGSGLGNRKYGRREPSSWPHCTLYPQKLVLTSPPSGCRSVGIVRLRTQAMEFFYT
jgi:hypothetical protein